MSGSWRTVAPAVAILAWGGNHFTPLLLFYRQTEHFSNVQVDLFLVTYVLGLIPGFLLSGPLSDRYGRKPLMFVGLGLGVLASTVLALGAPDAVVLSAGRLIAGLSVAIAMVVGSSWIKELSGAPFSPGTPAASGARRASLALTIGLGAGAGVSGVLAQWGPWPTLTPYAVHIALAIIAGIALVRAPNPALGARRSGALLADLGIPRPSRRRFLRVILPAAPWVFTAGALAYAVTPALVASRAGDDRVAFATLLTVVALAAGTLIQTLSPLVARLTRGHNLAVGVALAVPGSLLAALTAQSASMGAAIAASAVLGLAYGLVLVSGLVEVQRIAPPEHLAGVTAVFYSLTYVGFVLPVVLAALSSVTSYAVLLVAVAGAAAVCAVVVALRTRGERSSREPVDNDERMPETVDA